MRLREAFRKLTVPQGAAGGGKYRIFVCTYCFIKELMFLLPNSIIVIRIQEFPDENGHGIARFMLARDV